MHTKNAFFQEDFELRQEISRTYAQTVSAWFILIVPGLNLPLILIKSSRKETVVDGKLNGLYSESDAGRYSPAEDTEGQSHHSFTVKFGSNDFQKHFLSLCSQGA
jgi:hypothetical protein